MIEVNVFYLLSSALASVGLLLALTVGIPARHKTAYIAMAVTHIAVSILLAVIA